MERFGFSFNGIRMAPGNRGGPDPTKEIVYANEPPPSPPRSFEQAELEEAAEVVKGTGITPREAVDYADRAEAEDL
jgi:hypothetical protein